MFENEDRKQPTKKNGTPATGASEKINIAWPTQKSEPKEKKKKGKNKNENILCAIIALMKELDKSGLEFVKMDAHKRINKIEQRS